MPLRYNLFGFNVFAVLFCGLRAAAQQEGAPLDYQLEFAGNAIHVGLNYTQLDPSPAQ